MYSAFSRSIFLLSFQQKIATLSPFCANTVFNFPICLIVLTSISNDKHGLVYVGIAAFSVVNPTLIILEFTGIYCNCRWLLYDCWLKFCVISWGNFSTSCKWGGFHYLGICAFWCISWIFKWINFTCGQSIVDYVPKCLVHKPSKTSLISITSRTFEYLLNWELLNLLNF